VSGKEPLATWLPSSAQIAMASERAILASLDANLQLAVRVLLAEHLYVAPRGELRPDRLNVAFFDYNAFASMAFAACALLDLWIA
jgi:hypothetical protein